MTDDISNMNELPSGWVQTQLKKVCRVIVGGGTPSTKKEEYWLGNIPWISSADILGLKNIRPRKTVSEKAIINSTTNIVPKGTIIVVTRVGLGKIAIAPYDLCFSQDNQGLVLYDEIFNQKYVLYYLSVSVQNFKHSSRGTTINGVTKKQLADLNIAFPPIAEQQRIVDKIEELFSELDNGVEQLKKAAAQLKVYRQAVLKYAFEGKFTAKWRAENADKLETADELYKKVKLGNVAETCLGKMLDKKKNKGEYEPYLRNINVRWGEFDLSDLLEMRFEEREQERFSLQKGDLVVCEGGEPGRAAIWSGQVDNMKIQKALHRVRLNKDVLNSYLLYYLMYSAMSGQLGKYFTGTTIKHLTGTKLKQFEFPLPFIDEQSQIVQEIESRLSVCDKIEQSIKDGLAQAKALKQSILKKAFEGKLVPQDPNDEPAEKLLERIINIKVNS